jgi:hypothetical protein
VESGPLNALEALRREAVDAAQRKLAEARAELAQRESLFTEASVARQRCEEALQGERAHFSEARSVRSMRLVEERLAGLTHELTLAEGRLGAAEQASRRAHVRVREAEQELVQAELGRRSVSNVLSTRRSVADKRRERDEEDAAEDLFRARRRE